jgi:ABC-type dipeptide/oligopeptide/nickel transport system permease component
VSAVDYIAKRLGFAALTIFVAITLNFVIFRAAPGDATTALRCQACTQQVKAELRRDLGLDKSKPEQYWIYLKQLAHGDLGRSLVNQRPVRGELWQPIKNTLPMLLLGTLIAIVGGTLLGVLAAWRRGTLTDSGSVLGALAVYSMPTQWLALMLILYVADPLGLPTSGISDPYLSYLNPGAWNELVDHVKHVILPASTLGLTLLGEFTLITRSALLETLGEDYVLTARAKGLSNFAIVRKHAFRNSLLPISTLVFLQLGYLLGGTILVEAVFNYPGIGLLTYSAVFDRDYPILQGAFLVLTITVVLANLISDLLYVKLDPRVTG